MTWLMKKKSGRWQYVSKKKTDWFELSEATRNWWDCFYVKGQGDYCSFSRLIVKVPIGFALLETSRYQQSVWGNGERPCCIKLLRSSWFVRGIKVWCINCRPMPVVADRFHVMKLVNQDLSPKSITKSQPRADEVEKSELKQLLSKVNMRIKVRRRFDWEPKKAKLEEIREVLPSLAQMHQQKEALEPFLSKQRLEWWFLQLLDWLAEAQGYFQKVWALCRWLEK